MFTYGNYGLSRNNGGTLASLPLAISRYFERQAYLERQRPQTQRTPDELLVLLEDGRLTLCTYTDVRAGGLRVVRHPLNYNHLFPESKLVDVDITLPSTDLSLNDSFNSDIEFQYTIQEPPVEEPPSEPTTAEVV